MRESPWAVLRVLGLRAAKHLAETQPSRFALSRAESSCSWSWKAYSHVTPARSGTENDLVYLFAHGVKKRSLAKGWRENQLH